MLDVTVGLDLPFFAKAASAPPVSDQVMTVNVAMDLSENIASKARRAARHVTILVFEPCGVARWL